MTEVTLVEIERQRDASSRLDRINAVERMLAVLQTRFEAALERAVGGDDLKQLKREVDQQMKDTTNNIRAYFDSKTDQQSKDILSEVKLLLVENQIATSEEQKAFRRQVFFILLGTVLSVLGALFLFWTTGRG